jgi:hypothetical protein
MRETRSLRDSAALSPLLSFPLSFFLSLRLLLYFFFAIFLALNALSASHITLNLTLGVFTSFSVLSVIYRRFNFGLGHRSVTIFSIGRS